MHVSVHIYKHLALFFFCLICFCKVLSPPFILTLLDHVVLVSSASTTNTREIKNRFFFGWSGGFPPGSTKIVNTKQKSRFFFGFSHVFMIFCLLVFVYFPCLDFVF